MVFVFFLLLFAVFVSFTFSLLYGVTASLFFFFFSPLHLFPLSSRIRSDSFFLFFSFFCYWPACLYVILPTCLYVCLVFHLCTTSVCIPAYLSVFQSVCMFFFSLCLCLCVPKCSSPHLSVSGYLSLRLCPSRLPNTRDALGKTRLHQLVSALLRASSVRSDVTDRSGLSSVLPNLSWRPFNVANVEVIVILGNEENKSEILYLLMQ